MDTMHTGDATHRSTWHKYELWRQNHRRYFLIAIWRRL